MTEHGLVGAPLPAADADGSGGSGGGSGGGTPAGTRPSSASGAGAHSSRAPARRTVGMLPCPLEYQATLVERARSAAAAEAGGAPSALEAAADEELEQACNPLYAPEAATLGAGGCSPTLASSGYGSTYYGPCYAYSCYVYQCYTYHASRRPRSSTASTWRPKARSPGTNPDP